MALGVIGDCPICGQAYVNETGSEAVCGRCAEMYARTCEECGETAYPKVDWYEDDDTGRRLCGWCAQKAERQGHLVHLLDF